MKKPLICALFLLAAACGDAAGPSVRLSLQLTPGEPEDGSLPPTVISVDGGTVRVTGYFETPCMGEPVRGSASRPEPATIRIRIRAERQGANCATQADPYTYDGIVSNLDAGTYRVIVEHERDARRPDGPVREATLTLP